MRSKKKKDITEDDDPEQKSNYSLKVQQYLNAVEKKCKLECREKRPEACHNLAMFYERVEPELKTRKHLKSLRSLARSYYGLNCTSHDWAPSCLIAGEMTAEEEDFKPSWINKAYKDSLNYFDKACLLGSGEGCYRAGKLRNLELATKETSDIDLRKKTEQNFAKGCAINHRGSCTELGKMYKMWGGYLSSSRKKWKDALLDSENGDVSKMSAVCKEALAKEDKHNKRNEYLLYRDSEKSRLKTGKRHGNLSHLEKFNDYCTYLSDTCACPFSMFWTDLSKRREFAKVERCHELGLFYDDLGEDVEASFLFQRNCERHDWAPSCVKSGQHLAKLDYSRDRAADAFDRACELDNGEGCYLAGMTIMKSDPKEQREIEEYFAKGCALNEEKACIQLSALYRTGFPGELFFRNDWGVELPPALTENKEPESYGYHHSLIRMKCEEGEFLECAKLSEMCKLAFPLAAYKGEYSYFRILHILYRRKGLLEQ